VTFDAIIEFFSSRRMLKSINSTSISLIVQVLNPCFLKERRLISCYNVIYKIISKLLAKRITYIFPSIVGLNQTAFIKGKLILS